MELFTIFINTNNTIKYIVEYGDNIYSRTDEVNS